MFSLFIKGKKKMIENDSFSLYKGDCLEIMKRIPSNSIDMVLTDPPYGTTACKWDSIIDLNKMWNELKRIIKIDSAICLFGSEPFSSNLRMSNSEMFKYDFIWNKKEIFKKNGYGQSLTKSRLRKFLDKLLSPMFSGWLSCFYPV